MALVRPLLRDEMGVLLLPPAWVWDVWDADVRQPPRMPISLRGSEAAPALRWDIGVIMLLKGLLAIRGVRGVPATLCPRKELRADKGVAGGGAPLLLAAGEAMAKRGVGVVWLNGCCRCSPANGEDRSASAAAAAAGLLL